VVENLGGFSTNLPTERLRRQLERNASYTRLGNAFIRRTDAMAPRLGQVPGTNGRPEWRPYQAYWAE
jgi:hypothetical protein